MNNKFVSLPRVLYLSLFSAVMLSVPSFTMAQTADTTVNPYKLPFLREASSGNQVVRVTGDIPTTNDPTAVSGGLSSQANNCRFRDIPASNTAVNYLYDQDIVGGRRPCYFDPNLLATRAEVATMATRSVQASTPNDVVTNPFPDVSKTSWHARYEKSAKTRGVIHGYPDGQYRPDQAVNKVEAMKIITRTFGSDLSQTNSAITNYTDLYTDQWYMPYLNAGLNNGLIGPNGVVSDNSTTMEPAGYLTRADIADLIYTMIRKRLDQ